MGSRGLRGAGSRVGHRGQGGSQGTGRATEGREGHRGQGGPQGSGRAMGGVGRGRECCVG